jgi:L-malate glycosyltransferase
MKILLFLHELAFGGTTVNSVELAASLRDLHGHEVVVFATPGPMSRLVDDMGLRYLPAPVAPVHPSPSRMRALRDAVRRERPDLLYVWETWPCIDAYYAAHLPMGVPMLVTDMQMFVTHLLPRQVITTFGTPELVEMARAAGHRRTALLMPPVDIRLNAPQAVDPSSFRQRFGIHPDAITLVTVSRLVESMKVESLLRTVSAVGTLGRRLPLRLLIVGDGTARARIARHADEVNAQLGRSAVMLTGALTDPRAAYAVADIVVGMGGSALRGMAFGKPVIVVGERGFSAPFEPDTAGHFHYTGLYGVGDGRPTNTRLTQQIAHLADHRSTWPVLGEYGRRFVERHFALVVVTAQLAALCSEAVNHAPRYPLAATDALRTAAFYLRERRFLWRAPPPRWESRDV